MRKLAASLLAMLTMALANAHTYAEGQVWSYKARPGEQGSTLLINKIERDPSVGDIYHISVAGVAVKNVRAPGGVARELPHFPVSRLTLDASCIQLLRQSAPNPDYLAGYAEWKRAFDQHKAGIFTLPVAEIVAAVESTLNQ